MPSEARFSPNGVFVDTGRPLTLSPERVAAIAKTHPTGELEQRITKHKYLRTTQPTFGVVADVDASNLEEAGWGVIFSANATQTLKDALAPLIAHRRSEAGSNFRVFENYDGYQIGETSSDWLARHGTSMGPVDPLMGVPFYLLLVGSPGEIPFEFQYLLDIFWGVGRVHFDDPTDYRRYAESVVAYETGPPATARRAAIFATNHEFDEATQLFANEVAIPLAQGDSKRGPVGERQGFGLEALIGPPATKEGLTTLLRGKSMAGGRPALLVTGTHGTVFRADDPRLPEAQGALVCQDFKDWGHIDASHWFEANHLPADAQVHGLIHFLFACYGAGCPRHDDFAEPGKQPEAVAPYPLVARLPQKLLAHPNGGALAVLGHVDRAWSYSFHSAFGGPQVQSFRDVITRLLKGERLGLATDQFDVRWAALSAELSDVLRKVQLGKQVADWELGALWTARNDARNYVVLGDPAVRIRVEALST